MTSASSDTSAAAATWYLSCHRDLAVELNNAGCDMIELSLSSGSNAAAAAGSSQAASLCGAVAVLRDALDALNRPAPPAPSAVHFASSADADADGSGGHQASAALEEYHSYRDALWGRARERLDEACLLAASPSSAATAAAAAARRRTVNPLVYTDPIRLEPLRRDSSQQDPPPPLTVEEISAAVLFNLALAHHVGGEVDGTRVRIGRALRFYKMTESIVLRAMTMSSPPTTTSRPGSRARASQSQSHHLPTVVKAILNNVGQICLEWLGEDATGRAYFEKLASVIAAEKKEEEEEEELLEACSSRGAELEDAPMMASSSDKVGVMDAFAFNVLVTGSMNAAGAA